METVTELSGWSEPRRLPRQNRYQLAADYDLPEFWRLAGTLRRWQPQLLAYFDRRISNGPTEGRNLVIKQVKRTGYGYRNFTNYRLRVLHRCA